MHSQQDSRMVNDSHSAHLVNGFAVGLLLLTIYLVTGSQQYDLDVLSELRAINHLDVSSPDPAHMLYVRIGVPFYRMWLRCGYYGDALRPMQILNAVFGAATISFLYAILMRLGVRASMAFLTCMAAGLSYAFWTHTVDAFFIIPASFFSMFALFSALMLASAQNPAGRILCLMGLGLGFSLAALTYQASLSLMPALFVASWPPHKRSFRRHLQNWCLVAFGVVLIAGGAWLWQAIRWAHVESPSELIQWFFTSHGGTGDGALWRKANVNISSVLPTAWLATILPLYEGIGLRALTGGIVTVDRIPAQLGLVCLLGAALHCTYVALTDSPRIWESRIQRRIILTSLLWFVIPAATVTWFDPAEVELWLIPSFSFWLLLATVLSYSVGNPCSDRTRASISVVMLTLLSFLIPLANFLVPVWPNHKSPSARLALAQEAIRHMNENDLLISASFDWTGLVTYLASEYQVVNAIGIAQFSGKGMVRKVLWDEMHDTWHEGGDVYIVDYFSPANQEIWNRWITPYTDLTAGDFGEFQQQPAWGSASSTVWKLSQSQ